jgi:hypothetical protein
MSGMSRRRAIRVSRPKYCLSISEDRNNIVIAFLSYRASRRGCRKHTVRKRHLPAVNLGWNVRKET